MAKTKYHLHLKGFVGGWDFDRDYVEFVLTKYDGKRVDVLIDSLGGYVDTALSIASAFKNHGDVHVHFVGMNASAATIASLGAKEITMDKYAMYLAHKCSVDFFEWCQANADQLSDLIKDIEHQKNDLDKMDSTVATMYADRTGKSYAEILELMKQGSWLTSKEAKEIGFVDSITEDEDDEPTEITASLAAKMVAHGIPVPGNMKNAEQQTQSLFGKLIAALTNFFKLNNKPQESMENLEQTTPVSEQEVVETPETPEATEPVEETPETPETAEAPEAPEAPETPESQEPSEEEAEPNAEVEALQAEIAQLKAQIAELSKQPGDTTAQVVETSSEDNAFDGYLNTVNRAKRLYERLKGIK